MLWRFSDLNSFSFVHSAHPRDHHRDIERQLRSARKRQADSEQPKPESEAEAKQFTVAIKTAPTPKNLIETLDWVVDGLVFDFILASAAYTQLAYFGRRRVLEQSDWESPVLLRLNARVKEMALKDHLNERASANILWSLAQLSDCFRLPTELVDALVKSVPSKVRGMNEQNLSNSLWACARLQRTYPVVIDMVLVIAARIPNKAKDMIQQQLSNCLWASAQLKDAAPEVLKAVPAIVMHILTNPQAMQSQDMSNNLLAVVQLESEVPEVLEIVPAIVGEIPAKIQGMKPQEVSNSLEALVLLRDSVPEVAGFLEAGGKMDEIMKCGAERVDAKFPQLAGKDLSFTAPVVVWACAKSGVFHHELLLSVVERLGSPKKISAIPDFGVAALSWSYQELDCEYEFLTFRELLKSELDRRRLTNADVESCRRGRFRWSRV